MSKYAQFGSTMIRDHEDNNPAERFLGFIHLLASKDQISREEIKDELKIQNTAFYKYLRNARQLFPVVMEGSIGGNAYYSIDKRKLAVFFNIQHHHIEN